MYNNALPTLDQALAASISASGLSPVIDAATCAQLLCCTKEHVESLADRGELPAAKYGRGWVFVTAQLLVHVAARCTQNAGTRGSPSAGMRTSDEPANATPKQSTNGDEKPRADDRITLSPLARRRGRPRLPVPPA